LTVVKLEDCYYKVKEGLDNDKSVWSQFFGLHAGYNEVYNRRANFKELANLYKILPNKDRVLKFELLNVKCIVIVFYHKTVNKPLALYTHRPPGWPRRIFLKLDRKDLFD